MSIFEEYPKLETLFPTRLGFTTALIGGINVYENVLYTLPEQVTSITDFITSLAGAVYDYYKRDKVSYSGDDSDDIFIERFRFDFLKDVNRWLTSKNIQFLIYKNNDDGKYLLSSKMTSSSAEKGKSGSSVLQSSASTPTSVSPSSTGSTMSVDLTSPSNTQVSLTAVNNGYADKYTNFQGKTNGLHSNNITRDGNVERSGNYLQAIEVLKNLPESYFNEVLKDLSKHFIFTYDED